MITKANDSKYGNNGHTPTGSIRHLCDVEPWCRPCGFTPFELPPPTVRNIYMYIPIREFAKRKPDACLQTTPNLNLLSIPGVCKPLARRQLVNSDPIKSVYIVYLYPSVPYRIRSQFCFPREYCLHSFALPCELF